MEAVVVVVEAWRELLRKAGRRWDGWRNAGRDPAVRDCRGGEEEEQ